MHEANPPTPAIFADTARSRENAELVARFFAEVLAHGDPEAARLFLSPDFHDDDPAPGAATDGAGVVAKLAAMWAAFDDGRFTPHEIIAAGDRVVARSTFAGRHTGPFAGLAATGRPVSVPFVDIYVIVEGKIRGHAHVFDAGALMGQLRG